MSGTIDSFTYEYVDPWDVRNRDFWIKVEHLGRYLFALDRLSKFQPRIHLDLGCATGYGLAEIASACSRLVGVDYDEEALAAARALFSGRPGDITLLKANADDSSLDRILEPVLQGDFLSSATAFEVFEHLNDPGGTLEQLRASMSGGGLLLASVPNAQYEGVDPSGKPTNPYHDHIFQPGAFPALLKEAGFRVAETLGQGWVNRLFKAETKMARKDRTKSRPSAAEALHHFEVLRALASLLAYPSEEELAFTYSFIYVSYAI